MSALKERRDVDHRRLVIFCLGNLGAAHFRPKAPFFPASRS
jgi:hypothetical protein